MAHLIFLVPLAVSAVIPLGISVYTWYHRRVTGAGVYTWVAVSQSLTIIGFILELSAESLAPALFWHNVQWLTLSAVAVALLVFSLDFTSHMNARTARLWPVLMLIPVAFTALVATNRWHHLATDPGARLVEAPPLMILDVDLTLLELTLTAYLIGLGLASMVILARRIPASQPAHRRQLITLVCAIVIVLTGGIISLMEVVPGPQKDVMPVAFAISDMVVVWGLVRYRLFEVAPIARHSVVESMADALIVIDLHNRIVDVNCTARRLIEKLHPGTPVFGASFPRVFEDWSELCAPFTSHYAPLDLELTTGDAQNQRCYAISVAPVSSRSGFIVGRSILLKDITRHKRTEQTLREQARELESARLHAEQADQHKTEFLASVSHELRTPLNAIINFNQFVSNGLFGPVNGKQADALAKSTNSARHLLALINDVLDMSKIEAGHLELAIEYGIDLCADIQEVVASIDSLLADKPVDLFVIVSEPLPRVDVDRMRLRQVLLNLLTNAAKFTDAGHIAFSVVAYDGGLNVTVSDTGPGIAPDEQAIIFEPFRQSKRHSRPQSGTGLGLAISQRIIAAHGGTLRLESEIGRGSTFTVSIPLSSQVERTLS